MAEKVNAAPAKKGKFTGIMQKVVIGLAVLFALLVWAGSTAPEEEAAGVLVQGGLVTYVATCNMVTPFWPRRPAPPSLELHPPDSRGEKASVIYA